LTPHGNKKTRLNCRVASLKLDSYYAANMSSNNREKRGRPPGKPQRPLCKRIRERRERLKLSVDHCVEKSGIARSDWYRYESTTTPDAFAIRDIARTLKTTVEDLLRGL
jgi:hypothetical protein